MSSGRADGPVDPPFELASFEPTEVVVDGATGWDRGRLSIEALSLAGAPEPALDHVGIEIVRPGDPVRIANVLDAVLPDAKADDPATTFPGALGPLVLAGRGRTHRLGGVAVLSVCDWHAAGYTSSDELPDAIVDMAGPGVDVTAWGSTTNVVVRCVPAAGAPLADADRAVRRTALRVARDLAVTTIGAEPDDVRTVTRPLRPADPDLPAVCAIVQVASEGPLTDTFLYGEAVGGIVPTVVEASELLDGAVTNGAYDWPGVRNVTASYQDSSLLRTLLAAHGERLRFVGTILALGYLDTADQKRRSAMLSARLAGWLGADGAVCTTFSSGNSHTDTMLTVRALEALGIGATAIVAETNGGLTDHVPEADSIVSTGNEDALIEAWTPDRFLGSDGSVRSGEPVPMWAYLGSCVQTGDRSWTAVPA
jgi:glycine reductase complex component B subunit alpha and beta